MALGCAPLPEHITLDSEGDFCSAGFSLIVAYSGRTGGPGLYYLVPWVMQWFEKMSGIGLARGRHFLDQKKVAKD